MTADLKELLWLMRQHKAFHELLDHLSHEHAKPFRPSGDGQKQVHDWIFASGRTMENDLWRSFLTEAQPSDKENL